MKAFQFYILFCCSHFFGLGQKLDSTVWIIDSTYILRFNENLVKSNIDIPISNYSIKGNRLTLEFDKKMINALYPDSKKSNYKAKFIVKQKADSMIQLIGKNGLGKLLFIKVDSVENKKNSHSIEKISYSDFADYKNWTIFISDTSSNLMIEFTTDFIQKSTHDSMISNKNELTSLFESLLQRKPETIGFLYKDSKPILIKLIYKEIIVETYVVDFIIVEDLFK